MEIRPRRAETHPILAGVMMDEAILLPSSGAARAARLLKRAARVRFYSDLLDLSLICL